MWRVRVSMVLVVMGLVFTSACTAETTARPNIVLIMADDLGFADLGCYGGEIETPNLDALAANGVRFTQFKNTGRCCPSRASLMTGCYPHSVGMGWMTAVDEHRPGYRGQLSAKQPTIAELLKAAGYKSYMSGKWHLTVDGAYKGKSDYEPNGSWPSDRGFDGSWASLSGGGSYWHNNMLVRDDKALPAITEGGSWYYTHAITEHALGHINGHDFARPMFLYVAHYAPHRPLQAPAERIEQCMDRYRVGYDVLRRKRFERQRALGLIDGAVDLPKLEKVYKKQKGQPVWESLSAKQQAAWVKEMATYAAMVEIMDEGIGQLVDALKAKGQLDNTVIVFLSDNGATREGGFISQLAADLSNTPYQYYKKDSYNGGISSPLIVHWPAGLSGAGGKLNRTPSHIIDLVPTMMDIAGVGFPAEALAQGAIEPEGVTLRPLAVTRDASERTFYWEHQTGRAIYRDGWKLVSYHADAPWELYHLEQDPFEQHDVSAVQPEHAKALREAWERWAERNHVLPFEKRTWTARIKHYTQVNGDQDGID